MQPWVFTRFEDKDGEGVSDGLNQERDQAFLDSCS